MGQKVTPGTADEHLLDYIVQNHFTRVFLVTGHRSFSWFENRGFPQRLSEVSELVRWADARPNPEFSNLVEGVKELSRHDPDVIVGVGGGSVLDMAKLLAALSGKTNFDPVLLTTGAADLSSRNVRLVLVPTTAGSGAEATHFSVLYRDSRKYSVAGAGLLADRVVLDPELVTSGDSRQLAASGLDALCQCVESIWAKGSSIPSEKMALEGLRAITRGLVGFVEGDKSLAGLMQWGSHLAGHAINISRTTASHALSYFLTNHLGVPHGVAVASTLGYFIDHHNVTVKTGNSPGEKNEKAMGIIREALNLRESATATEYFSQLFRKLGLEEPRKYWPQDAGTIEKWIDSVDLERLGNHPLALKKQDLRGILGLK